MSKTSKIPPVGERETFSINTEHLREQMGWFISIKCATTG